MKNEEWVVVDTETNGLYPPVFTLEIAAQRMIGWEPAGDPFQILLNHDVPIDPAAQAVHGYSREFLRKAGRAPLEAHALFRDYAGDRPIVAYNLSFDWDRVLQPEWQRLRLPAAGCKGFCAMTLARRVIHETVNHRLETMKQHFRLTESRSHRGLNDVMTVVELFGGVFRERLAASGVVGFEAVAVFSRRTPIAGCHAALRRGCQPEPEAPAPIRTEPAVRATPVVRPMTVTRVKSVIRDVLRVCRKVEEEGPEGRAMAALRKKIEACPYPSIYPMCAIRRQMEQPNAAPAALMAVIGDALAAYEDSQA